MAEDGAHQTEESGLPGDAEKKIDRGSSAGCRLKDQRAKVKDKLDESRLPTPPPDPQCLRFARGVTSRTVSRPEEEEEEEDLAAYLNELGTSPFESHSFDYDTPNSTAASAMGGAGGPFAEEAFEHLDRLCALTEQILELRDRSCKHFRRVRALERAKALRNADRRLENALANDEELLGDLSDEDTGFAESLLDAMLSNCREPPAQRRSDRSNMRSPSSRQRSRSLALTEQTLSGTSGVAERPEADKRATRNVRNGGPKISKWTRVKAAFKWERACTNDLVEIAETSVAAPSTPTTRYLRIPEVVGAGSWSGSALSPCTSEVSSPSTPIGRVSPASSSNEEVIDEPRRSALNYPDRQSPQGKDDRKKDDTDRCGRSFDRDTSVIVENTDPTESSNEASRGKPLIRITSDGNATTRTTNVSGKEPSASPKRPTPTLTITIPSNEEEIRNLSSPESISPLLSSAQDSGGSSPQRPKARQDMQSPREFKRQYSTIEEVVMSAPKIQRQDSKWNKVRRAFLTNATFSVPPSPVKVMPVQSFSNDDKRRTRSCSESVEDLGKTVAGTNQVRSEALRDYQALREKFGAEFHRKLVEWERLKSGGSVAVARNTRDGLPLNEERLAPEFRKKLQEWKRAKKGRRSGASIEQQRVSRRRLTDWQLWRSSSKLEPRCYKNQNSISSRGSCASIGSAGSFASDGRQHLCEDFVKRMETWRKMSEAACRNNERPRPPPPPPTSRVASDLIDETEFLALEKLLTLFGQKDKKERRENDAKQLNDCFDGDSRFTATTRGVGCGNEVLIRTSVGSYRFEGISREFTRKLYDWEKYRGISPRSSTFRLLAPGYTPFAQDSDEATLAESPTNTTGKSRAFHWSLKRSKSDGSIFEGGLRNESSYTLRRSTSLQSLMSPANKLEDSNRIGALPTSENTQGIKDTSEDTAVEDSEPEAMIVDIEDVIEETASPLERVQPHQTPVYSVAASETTSIAVPLGTVTSSHEPSPVFLVEAEDEDCERWNGRIWHDQAIRLSENSPSPERFPGDWCEDSERTTSLDEDKSGWRSNWRDKRGEKEESDVGWAEETRRHPQLSNDSVKFDRAIEWNRDAWNGSGEIFQRYPLNEANRNPVELESPLEPESRTAGSDVRRQNLFESDNAGSAQSASFGTSAWSAEELMDSPRTCERMKNETGKLEDPADESSDERMNNAEDHRAVEEAGKTMANTTSRSHHLAMILSDRCVSKQTSSNISKLNLDDSKDTQDTECKISPRCEDHSPADLQTDVDRHYETLTFSNAQTRNDKLHDHFLYEPVNCQNNHEVPSHKNHVQENLSLFGPPATPANILTESAIRTIPITVSGNSETRCLEKILITEDTLNRIIVPTTSAENGAKRAEMLREKFATRPEEISGDRRRDCDRSSFAKTNDEHQTTKKDGSITKNVFVKTKRMIFGPFRRSDDRSSSSRKESDSSMDDRPPCVKSKSKSRSTSPKLCRQDALLRVSLSLPWPLRSTSKENDATLEDESRRSSGDRMEDAAKRNSPRREVLNDEKKVDNEDFKDRPTEEFSAVEANRQKVSQLNSNSVQSKISSGLQNRNICGMQDERGQYEEVNCSGEHREEKRSEERQNDTLTTHNRKQNDKWQQDEAQSRIDAVPSDLMHKLRILSDAAARREGRVAITEVSTAISTSESRSSRIRRAKESFLSRRGGPFCRSMLNSTENTEDETRDPWRRTLNRVEISRTSKIIEVTTSTLKPEASGCAENRVNPSTMRPQDESSTSSGDKDDREADVGLRADLVKSASAGMINVDPDTFGRLVAVDRGCESLPRTIAKRRDTSGPLAKIVSKLKLSRLIRARNAESGGGMSTISTLCRQSLLIDMQNNPEIRESGNATGDDMMEDAANESEEDDDDERRQLESSRITRE